VAPLTYAAITPARDEAENLARLARSLAEQSLTPAAWIVVDDGSTDGSATVVRDFALEHDWAHLITSPAAAKPGSLQLGRREGRDVVAFNAGLVALPVRPDIVLKLDADVSLDPDFFERLLREFDVDALLGIAGGICLEQEGGSWRARHVTGDHVRGATRAYRWSCLEEVSPLVERLGWDSIDEAKASVRGWRVRSVEGLEFYHHRPVGIRDGAWSSWESQGATARFLGYRLSYLVARALFRARRDPRALGMLVGWVRAAARREPVYADHEVVDHLRTQQKISSLPVRALEALGRR
jgi:biofilm PGA synthesis N-glycosyltransferase PgaC